MKCNRRTFLRTAAHSALAGVGVLGALGTLRLANAAIAAAGPFSDYKALVCIFLLGGNDGFNMVVPTGGYHGVYAAQRGPLALDAASLLALHPVSDGMPSDGNVYGLHPSMPELASLFNAGKAAIIANVGSLIYPTTKAAYLSGTNLPPQLFAHNDQQNQWQTARPDNAAAAGWGGRVADLLHAANPDGVPPTIAVAQQYPFLRGNSTNQYVTDAGGLTQIGFEAMPGANVSLFRSLRQPGAQTNMIQRAYAGAMSHAIDTYKTISAALPPGGTYSGFSSGNDGGSGQQMETVARLIRASSGALGMHRQVFFVGIGGFDTHNAQLAVQASLLAALSKNINALLAALEQMGLSDNVTIFTASDFGRTLSVNSDGTDHGWGSHHFAVGGAVLGKRFFGKMPNLSATSQNPDDAGWGQIIPTTSVDQYASALARWFGVDADGIATIFPNLPHFAGGSLGIMK